jgi:hypothetical protein
VKAEPKEFGLGELTGKIFRQPTRGLNTITLRYDTGPECAGGFEKRSTGSRIGHRPLRSETKFEEMTLWKRRFREFVSST